MKNFLAFIFLFFLTINATMYQRFSDLELGAENFGGIVLLYMTDVIGATEARNRLNSLLTSDGYNALDAGEQTELSDMKTTFDALSDAAKNTYLLKLLLFPVNLQRGSMNQTEFETGLGID